MELLSEVFLCHGQFKRHYCKGRQRRLSRQRLGMATIEETGVTLNKSIPVPANVVLLATMPSQGSPSGPRRSTVRSTQSTDGSPRSSWYTSPGCMGWCVRRFRLPRMPGMSICALLTGTRRSMCCLRTCQIWTGQSRIRAGRVCGASR